MKTIFFPQTWLYRHCATWLINHGWTDFQIISGLERNKVDGLYRHTFRPVEFHPKTYTCLIGNNRGKITTKNNLA